jgi:hypothetical protein
VSQGRFGALTASTFALEHAAQVLAQRLVELEVRIQAGDESAWGLYVQTTMALASVVPNLSQERRGELLTTAEMATRLGIKPKTLLKRKGKGQIRPAMQAGKLIRWRGTESVS